MAKDTFTVVGPVSIDQYLSTGEQLPGGGALNIAYHWAGADRSFTLVSRIAATDQSVFAEFFDRHHIASTESLIAAGDSCSIDVIFGDDRQPWMDNFVEGVWSSFALSAAEIELISQAATHFVLVDVIDRELLRVAALGAFGRVRLSGDFLSFRHFTPERFAATFALLEIGFIGWPGDPDDPLVDELGAHAARNGNVLVLTFGSLGIAVFDGRSGVHERLWFDVVPQPVTGTTIGCGDAFIAAFLADWWRRGDITLAIEAGRLLGADATTWDRALPDAAYG